MAPTTRSSLKRDYDPKKPLKCFSCEEQEIQLKKKCENFNFEDNCPCLILLCENCVQKYRDEKDEDEYCPLDKHSSYEDFRCRTQTESFIPEKGEHSEGSVLESQNQSNNEFFKIDKDKNIYIQCIVNKESGKFSLELYNHPEGPVLKINSDDNKENPKDKISSKKSFSWISYFLTPILVVLLAIGAAFFFYPEQTNQMVCKIYEFKFCEPSSIEPSSIVCVKPELNIDEVNHKLKNIENNFKKQPRDLWGIVRQAFKNVYRVTEPTTLLLVHNPNTPINECFLEQIKKLSSYIVYHSLVNRTACDEFDKIKQSDRGIVLDMANDEYRKFTNPGEFMEQYKGPLEKDLLLIVLNFHKAPLPVIQAFQHFSDIVTPYVKGAFIILTLPINIDKVESDRLIVNKAEEKIKELTVSLPDKLVDPLITRITEHVVLFENEGRGSCQLFH